MLFDLSSPGRKTAIRIIYGTLALLFVVGFVGFGIGGELGSGGLVDGLTGGGSSTADQYEQQIDDAEETLETDPDNANALATLAQFRFLSGQVQLEIDDQTGQPTGLTEDSRGEFEAAIDAWNRYLDTDPRKVDLTTANNIVGAYQSLGDLNGATEAQEILAESNPTSQTYSTLAFYQYQSFDFEAGDEAAELAIADAPKDQARTIEKQLERIREQAETFEKAQERLPEDEAGGELDSPFGDLGPGGDPTAPPVP